MAPFKSPMAAWCARTAFFSAELRNYKVTSQWFVPENDDQLQTSLLLDKLNHRAGFPFLPKSRLEKLFLKTFAAGNAGAEVGGAVVEADLAEGAVAPIEGVRVGFD
jgi:hypothetical protein